MKRVIDHTLRFTVYDHAIEVRREAGAWLDVCEDVETGERTPCVSYARGEHVLVDGQPLAGDGLIALHGEPCEPHPLAGLIEKV